MSPAAIPWASRLHSDAGCARKSCAPRSPSSSIFSKKTEQVKRRTEERTRLIHEQAARAEAEARQERLAFLADASNVLAGSLEYRETFENLAKLIVPRLADFLPHSRG